MRIWDAAVVAFRFLVEFVATAPTSPTGPQRRYAVVELRRPKPNAAHRRSPRTFDSEAHAAELNRMQAKYKRASLNNRDQNLTG